MSNDYPRISIITPSFNQGRFLRQTIQSVVSQNYPNLEYLIFDGGSSDNSVEIIKEFSKKYPEIKWRSKKDRGQVDAINNGLERATGDIVAYINSDDYYLPSSFRKVASYFSKNPHKKWVVGDCRISRSDLNWTFTLKRLSPFDRSIIGLQIYNPINQPAVFLTKDMAKRVGHFNDKYKYAFDYDYWLRCAGISLPGRINSNLAVFRVHQNSKGSTSYEKQFEEDYQIIKKYSKNPFIYAIHLVSKYLTLASYRFLK